MKIAHISDLHFGNNNKSILDTFIIEMKRIKPDFIIVSGDLTQRAKSYQFREFRKFIDKIPFKIFFVPGNHDIPFWNPVTRILNPFSQYKRFVNNNTRFIWENNNIRIMGLNSVNPFRVKTGDLSSTDLNFIKTHFSSDYSKVNLLFFHHNAKYLKGFHKPIKSNQALIDVLRQSAIHIVCTGHLHYAHVSTINKTNHLPCLLLHAGSLSCLRSKDNRNSYFLLNIKQFQCAITLRVFEHGIFSDANEYHINLLKKGNLHY